jgi:hypothetical protein
MTPAQDLQPVLPSLELAEAQAWATLQRRLHQLQGFGLLIFFVRTPQLANQLKARLTELLHSQQRVLATVTASHPENFADLALKALLGTHESPDTGAHWLEAYRGAGQAAWDKERRVLLARLNERRSRLEAEFQVPLILLLPAGGMAEMATLAPDLWHIRIFTFVLEASLELGAADVRPALASAPAVMVATSPQIEPAVRTALDYWFDQWRVNFDDFGRDDLRADHPHLWAISIWDGVHAIQTCVQYGRFEHARHIAQDVLALARLRQSAAGSGSQCGPALRDLSVSLDNVGGVARAQGDWVEAETAYRESLAIRRELAERLGGTPEAQDDLGRSLMNVASMSTIDRADLLAQAATIYDDLISRFADQPVYAERLRRVHQAMASHAGANEPSSNTT